MNLSPSTSALVMTARTSDSAWIIAIAILAAPASGFAACDNRNQTSHVVFATIAPEQLEGTVRAQTLVCIDTELRGDQGIKTELAQSYPGYIFEKRANEQVKRFYWPEAPDVHGTYVEVNDTCLQDSLFVEFGNLTLRSVEERLTLSHTETTKPISYEANIDQIEFLPPKVEDGHQDGEPCEFFFSYVRADDYVIARVIETGAPINILASDDQTVIGTIGADRISRFLAEDADSTEIRVDLEWPPPDASEPNTGISRHFRSKFQPDSLNVTMTKVKGTP